MELTTPVFFIIGSDASNCNITRLDVRYIMTDECIVLTDILVQELRDKLKVESSMTIVTGADEQVGRYVDCRVTVGHCGLDL